MFACTCAYTVFSGAGCWRDGDLGMFEVLFEFCPVSVETLFSACYSLVAETCPALK